MYRAQHTENHTQPAPSAAHAESITRRRGTARTSFHERIERLLALADVCIGGDRPWDLQVHNEDLYPRVFAEGELGLGEAYMDGWWDCAALDAFFDRVLRARLGTLIVPHKEVFNVLKARLWNLQSRTRAFQVGQDHYDIGNDLYRRMLDQRMIYSCAYWQGATTLDEAQTAKLDLICRKLDLQPGMRVLDIGCGWGGTARFAAERYGVEVVGITISKEQVVFARENCRDLPVEIRWQDYRDLQGTFDRILSVGMFEHVGFKNYATFMRVVRRCLASDGLFLLHTIGSRQTDMRPYPWFNRYIFPNGMLPSARQIATAIDGLFILEDWHNFGADYDRTLMSWFQNFDMHREAIKAEYGERFYRMWKYYLLSCAGSFRARQNQVYQLVLSPHGVPGGYRRPHG